NHGTELLRRFGSRIDKCRHPTRTGHQFQQELLALTVKLIGEDAESSCVTARTRERSCQPRSHHVVGNTDYRNRTRHLLRSAHRSIAAGKDDVGTGLDLVLLCAAAKAARIDDKISTFDEPLPA